MYIFINIRCVYYIYIYIFKIILSPEINLVTFFSLFVAGFSSPFSPPLLLIQKEKEVGKCVLNILIFMLKGKRSLKCQKILCLHARNIGVGSRQNVTVEADMMQILKENRIETLVCGVRMSEQTGE